MSRDQALRDRLLDRRREIHKVDAEITGAWIEHTWPESRRRQLHERMTLTDRDRFRHGHDFSNVLSRGLSCEREGGFNFRVLRKVFCVRKIECAARFIEPVSSLLSALKCLRYLVDVAQIKFRCVYQHATAFFSGDFEAPQCRLRKRITDCETLVIVVTDRAEVVVRRDQQHAWASAIKTNDCAVTELTTVETDVV